MARAAIPSNFSECDTLYTSCKSASLEYAVMSITVASVRAGHSENPPHRRSKEALRSGIGNKRFIPGLDGLRALAVLAVICAHKGIMWKAQIHTERFHSDGLSSLLAIDIGDLGVSMFFTISGYLISTLLLNAKASSLGLDLREFYLRRFFRIFPPYYAYLCIVCLLWAVGFVVLAQPAIFSSFAYISNYVPYRITHPDSTGWVVGHTWSLSLEEQFYLLWPIMVAKLNRNKLVWIGCATLLLSPLLRLLTLGLFPSLAFDWQIGRMFHTRIDTIMVGSVLALLESKDSFRKQTKRISQHFWILAVTSFALLLDLALNAKSKSFYLMAGLTVEAAMLTLIMRCCIEQQATWVGKFLNWRVMRHIGVLSYSLYLWQQLFCYPSGVADRLRGLRGAHVITLVLTFVCAEISYFTIERTSYCLRDRLLTPRQQARVL